MPEDETSKNVNATLFSILATICVLLSGFSLKWSFDANADMKAQTVQLEHMTKAIETLSKKSELDKKQDASLSKHWRLHNWSRTEINNLRFKNQDEPADWPDLSAGPGQ